MLIVKRLAAKGIRQGDFQRALHDDNKDFKFFYTQRYESIAMISYSCVAATLSLYMIF